jgi:hypothetical protein
MTEYPLPSVAASQRAEPNGTARVPPTSARHATVISFQSLRMPSPQRTSPRLEPSPEPSPPSQSQRAIVTPNQFVEPELLYGVCEYRRNG